MKPLKTRSFLLTAAALLTCGLATLGQAQGTGFEPGDPALSTVGDAGTKQTFQGVPPPGGANQFLLTTINENGVDGTDGFSNQSGSNAVSSATLNAFVGANVVGTEGSAFQLSILITPGANVITFGYNFLTNEFSPGDSQDLAFAVLLDSANNVIGGIRTIATPASINFNDPNRQLAGSDPFLFDTGYQTFNITVATAGTYTLSIGVVDRTDTDSPSGLLVDNVRIIPEPSTVALAFAGLGLLVGFQRVRAKRS